MTTEMGAAHRQKTEEPGECGLGHACTFCPKEETCQRDKKGHDTHLIQERLARIDQVILVMANKGGVGKSTVAANLAVALSKNGQTVGLADADVHGPNAPRIFGLQDTRVRIDAAGLDTPTSSGVQVGSLAFMLPDADTPIVWRDAYKHDYIHHMIGTFNWGRLDYLIIDMPPGTGNELITLADMLESRGPQALLVSTADAIALQDTLKAARFCRERGLPIVGLVENYAGTVCPHCGNEIDLFERAPEVDQFEENGIPTLARVPFSKELTLAAAKGVPAASASEGLIPSLFSEIANACTHAAKSAALSR